MDELVSRGSGVAMTRYATSKEAMSAAIGPTTVFVPAMEGVGRGETRLWEVLRP